MIGGSAIKNCKIIYTKTRFIPLNSFFLILLQSKAFLIHLNDSSVYQWILNDTAHGLYGKFGFEPVHIH